MRCIKCLFKNLTTHRLFLVFVPVLSFFGLLLSSSSVSAESEITSTIVAPSVQSVSFSYTGGNPTITGANPWNFEFGGLADVSTQYRAIHPTFNLSSTASQTSPGDYFTLFIDITATTVYNATPPSVLCPNSLSSSRYIIDYCEVSTGGTSSLSSPSNLMITRWYMFIRGHVNDVTYTSSMQFRGALFTSYGATIFNLGVSNVRFFSGSSTTANAIEQQTAQDKEFHDEAQDTFNDSQDSANTDADSSSQQAEQSGSTLLEAVTQFIGALTGSSASNCVINANIGEFEMGNVDLCQLSPPPAFQVISSLMVIGFAVPLSIALAKKMISLFRSFQG